VGAEIMSGGTAAAVVGGAICVAAVVLIAWAALT
jgi:hypothetical protein